MQIHQLKLNQKKKKKKRIGRGGKKGNYCGKGIKGQSARSGKKIQPFIREVIKRYPKLKGYKFSTIKKNEAIINLIDLEKKFKKNEKINPKILINKGLVKRIKGKIPDIKILAKGEITKPFIIENCLLSKSAKEKIKKVKGKIL